MVKVVIEGVFDGRPIRRTLTDVVWMRMNPPDGSAWCGNQYRWAIVSNGFVDEPMIADPPGKTREEGD